MGQLQEFLETIGTRVKSPILGSIIFAFFIFNWRAVFFLLFAEQNLLDRFAFFDDNTTIHSLYTWPILAGIGLSVITPWLSLAGSLLASFPTQKQRILVDRLASDRLLQKARLAQARDYEQSVMEKQMIARTKRDLEVAEIPDAQAREKLQDELDASRLAQELVEAEETRDLAISYLQQREGELTSQISQTEAELNAAMESLSEARRELAQLSKKDD